MPEQHQREPYKAVELCEISQQSRDTLSINRLVVIITGKCPIFLLMDLCVLIHH